MKRPFSGTFPITQEWGVNPADYARFGLKGHNGVDYGTPTGTPILAPHSGKVIEALFDATGYGNYVKIENDKEGSILAHFQSFNVKVGDTVSEGQQVGISDNTGNSTGPHLHWGYYRMPRNKSDGFSGTCNPYPYLSENQATTTTPTPSTSSDQCQIDLAEITKDRNRLNDVIGLEKDPQIRQLTKDIEAVKVQCALDVKTAKDQADSSALQLIECYKQRDIYKGEYDNATKEGGYKEQITHLEENKKAMQLELSEAQRLSSYWQTKYKAIKKSGLKFLQHAVILLCEKAGVDLKEL